MATMVAEVYDALPEAGASPDKARAAATAMALPNPELHDLAGAVRELAGSVNELRAGFVDLGKRVGDLDRRFSEFEKRSAQFEKIVDTRLAAIDVRFAAMDGRMTLLQWMGGTVIAGLVALFVKVLTS
jgi:hypothetical protein